MLVESSLSLGQCAKWVIPLPATPIANYAAHPLPEIEQQIGSLSPLSVTHPVYLAMLIAGPTSQVLETWLLEAVGNLELVGLLRDRRMWWKLGSCSELAEAFFFFSPFSSLC